VVDPERRKRTPRLFSVCILHVKGRTNIAKYVGFRKLFIIFVVFIFCVLYFFEFQVTFCLDNYLGFCKLFIIFVNCIFAGITIF